MTTVQVTPASQRQSRAWRAYAPLLRAYLAPQRRRVVLLALLLALTIALELLNPRILGFFIDTAQRGGAYGTLISAAVVFLGVALLTQLAGVGETYLAENVGLTATNRLRADLTLHCLTLDSAFHTAHTPGELIERVDGDVATLGNFFARLVVQVFGNGLLLAGVLVALWGIDWRVGAALTVFCLGSLVVVNRMRDWATPRWAAARQASAEIYGFLEERLSGTEDIRANGAPPYVLRRLAERSRALLRRERNARIMGTATWGTLRVLFAVGTAIALLLGAYLYRAGTITLGTVYLVFAYTQLLSRPLDQIARQLQDLQQATASIARIQALFALQPSLRDGDRTHLPLGPLAVEFDHVAFGYSADEPVVRDLTLDVVPGQIVGVLGRTGSGKTTLTRLLFRLYDPDHGAVRLGGVDLRDLRVQTLRERIGIVTQEIQLFHASARDNLSFFDPTIPDERITAVLHELGLDAWLAALPDGLNTKLAPGGSGLSAGEAQLLAFARVFLRDPGLVILDEASSRLDPLTERRVERAVDRLFHNRTGIIIAHRLQTVERADMIMILERGQVVEWGARRALINDPASRFAQLLRMGLEEALA